jgi:hypothetical protein
MRHGPDPAREVEGRSAAGLSQIVDQRGTPRRRGWIGFFACLGSWARRRRGGRGSAGKAPCRVLVMAGGHRAELAIQRDPSGFHRAVVTGALTAANVRLIEEWLAPLRLCCLGVEIDLRAVGLIADGASEMLLRIQRRFVAADATCRLRWGCAEVQARRSLRGGDLRPRARRPTPPRPPASLSLSDAR